MTDVVVLRNTGDTVNFWGLDITKTSRGFEVRNSLELVDFLAEALLGCKMSKPVATTGRRATVKELASAIPLQGHDYSTYRTAVGKLICMAPWRPDMSVCNSTDVNTSERAYN